MAGRGLGHAPAVFTKNESVYGAGVLFLIPALLSQGLLKTKQVYQMPSNHYYSLESVILTLAIMALSRIKTPEQLKQCKPGELGRLIGLDRIPEVKCLRNKIKILSDQNQSSRLNDLLIDHWYNKESEDRHFLYIDGHQRIYYGKKANLPSKYISRQKLCLSATTEYWVNDMEGLPVMMVIGELSEKLQDIIEHEIIPKLQKTVLVKQNRQPNQPACTLIFDREAYEPAFFERLWQRYGIAVITYRKNVTDKWASVDFESIETKVLENKITMHICEKKVTLSDCEFREVRRLSNNGHQASIITNHPTIEKAEIAGKMFGRWAQENFFKYMIADYDFDKMVAFGVEEIDQNRKVVNPTYRKLNHKLKKLREKKRRLQAKVYELSDKVIEKPIDEIPKLNAKKLNLIQQIKQYEDQEKQLVEQRKTIPYKITLEQMPDDKRYNKLKQESKIMMNIIKTICYRAESVMANLITNKLDGAKRMCIKQLIHNNADIIPDYDKNTLVIRLHAMSTRRYNKAIGDIITILNESQTIFPGTNLKMIFKCTAF